MQNYCLQSHLNGVCGSIHRTRNRLPTELKGVSCLFSWCNIWDTKTSPLCIRTVSFCVSWWQWKGVESYFHHKSFWNCDIPETSWAWWRLGGKIKAWKKSRGSTDNFWRGTCCKKKTNKQTNFNSSNSRISYMSYMSTLLDYAGVSWIQFLCHMFQNSKIIWLLMLVLQFLASFSNVMHVVHCKQKEESFFLVTPI